MDLPDPQQSPRRVDVTAGESIVELTDVHLHLASAGGEVNILRGLDLSVNAGETIDHRMAKGRAAYLVVSEGAVEIAGEIAPHRAGVTITGEDSVTIKALEDAEVVLVDVPV